MFFLTEEEIKAESTRKLEELKTKGPFEKNDGRNFGRDTESWEEVDA